MRPIYRDLLVLLIVALLGGVIGWVIKPCPTCIGTVSVSVTDSTAPNKDTVAKVWDAKPNKVETRRRNYSYTKDTNKINAFEHFNVNIDTLSYTNYCLDTNIYKNDTISVDNFRATSTAYVTGNELVKLQIEWLNLKPELWKIKRETITVEKKQSIVKVYTGIYAGVSIANKTVASYHGGVGLDAIISDRHLIGFQGGLNSSLQPEFGVRFSEKIRLKK